MTMNNNDVIWRQYYDKALSRPHHPRTAQAASLNQSDCMVAIDCGCGTGSDIDYLLDRKYQVHGFDINPVALSLCKQRFGNHPCLHLSEASFDDFAYPEAGVIVANSSLLFAEPKKLSAIWKRISTALVKGGVFAGNFMGPDDTWATNYRSSTAPISEKQLQKMFTEFEIVRWDEQNEAGMTSLGRPKHWHSFSVTAIKR